MAESTCIYAPCEGVPTSEEHPLSKGFGTFYRSGLLKGRVCRECNGAIGRDAELPFMRTGLVGHLRWVVGLPRRGSAEDADSPFYRGAAGVPPIKNVGRLAGSNHDALFDVIPGSVDMSPPLKHMLLETLAGDSVLVPLSDAVRTADDLRRVLSKAGATGARPVRMFHEPDHPIMDAVRAVFPGISVSSTVPFRADGARVELQTELFMTPHHFRAIAKIGFHYFLREFDTRFRGDEPAFSAIRDFIRYGRGDVAAFVRERTRPVAMNYPKGELPGRWMHVLTASVRPAMISATCQFYAGPKLMHHGWDVFIARDYGRVLASPDVRSIHAHRFVYYDEPDGQHDGAMEDMHPVDRLIIP